VPCCTKRGRKAPLTSLATIRQVFDKATERIGASESHEGNSGGTSTSGRRHKDEWTPTKPNPTNINLGIRDMFQSLAAFALPYGVFYGGLVALLHALTMDYFRTKYLQYS
jgi:hypothetical protein